MTENYLLVQSKVSLKLLKSKIAALDGFFNGIGYAFPLHRKAEVHELFHKFSASSITSGELPLTSPNFAAFRASFKTDYWRQVLSQKQAEIAVMQSQAGIANFSEQDVISCDLSADKKDFLVKLFHEEADLRDKLANAEALEEALATSSGKKLELKFLSECPTNYLDTDAPPKPCLMYWTEKNGQKQPFLHKEIAAMVVAGGGVGKTHLLAQLALCAVTGIPFLGKFEFEAPGHACFILGENDQGDIHRLIRKTRKSLDVAMKDNEKKRLDERFTLHVPNPLENAAERLMLCSAHGLSGTFINDRGEPTEFFNDIVSQLIAKEPSTGWQLILLDPISRFAGLNAEKDNALATRFVACLEKLSSSLKGKPTVLFAHHKPKNAVAGESDQTAARGASGLTDGVRWQANLDIEAKQTVFRLVKTNFTAYLPPFYLKKDVHGLPQFDEFVS